METLFAGNTIMEFDELASTSEYALKLLKTKMLTEGTVIQAHYQSWGKGYENAQWQSDRRKNLLISMVLKPHFLAPRKQFFLNQSICLAVSDTVMKLLPEQLIKIKWPNDVYYNNKKLAGILIENSIAGEMIQHSIVGIGLNVNQTDFGSLRNATSLQQIANKEFNISEVLNLLCSHIESRYLHLKSDQIEQLQRDYMQRLFRVQEESVFIANGKKFTAKIMGITPDGKLILNEGKEARVYNFKEVELVL